MKVRTKYRIDAWVITDDAAKVEAIFNDIMSRLRDAKTKGKVLNGQVTRTEIMEPEEYSEGV